MRAGTIAILAFVSFAAIAADTAPTWPPSEAGSKRIAELQAVIASRDATDAERKAARTELATYLKPGKLPEGKPPARAATSPVPGYIDTPTIGKSFKGKPLPATAPVTQIAPLAPTSTPIPNPAGGVIIPTPGGAVNPRTGAALVETPAGYVDPRTGQFVPKR